MTINGCVWPSTPGSALGPAGESRSELTGWLVQTSSWSQPLHPYLGPGGEVTCGTRRRLRLTQTQVGPRAQCVTNVVRGPQDLTLSLEGKALVTRRQVSGSPHLGTGSDSRTWHGPWGSAHRGITRCVVTMPA